MTTEQKKDRSDLCLLMFGTFGIIIAIMLAILMLTGMASMDWLFALIPLAFIIMDSFGSIGSSD